MTESPEQVQSPESTSTPARRGRARQVAGKDVVDAIDRLPRKRMTVPNESAPSAAELEAEAAKKRAANEAIYRQLLGAVAENPEAEAVAKAMGWPVDALSAFLSEHRQFASTRYEAVRSRHTAAVMPEVSAADFIWTDDKRRRLIEKYVDRGDLLEAQEFVGCTPSQFNREIRANREFAAHVENSKRDATETLRMRALKDGLGGNDKVLSLFLKALEDGRDKDGVQHLTDEQLDRDVIGLLGQLHTKLKDLGEDDERARDLLKASDVALVLRVATSEIKSTAQHDKAALAIGRTVAQFEEFLAGCAEVGLTAAVQAYRDELKKLSAPAPWPNQ